MLTVVGNSLNSGNKKVLDKMAKIDLEYIRKETLQQKAGGAQYIKLDATSLQENELDYLCQAIPVVEEQGAHVMVYSNTMSTLLEVIPLARKEIIVGPVEFRREKIDPLLERMATAKLPVKLVASTVNADRPDDDICPEAALLTAQEFLDYLLDQGVSRSDILLDPVVRSLESNPRNGKVFLNTLELFKLDFPQVGTIANLSALSEGLPRRENISPFFLALAMAKGLDFAVMNVQETGMAKALVVTTAIIGKDRNLESYTDFCRQDRTARSSGRA